MKKFFFIILIINSLFISCQSIPYGTYESKEGSELTLNKNKTFNYIKSNSKVESDIISIDFEYESYGEFKQKDNKLFLTSEEIKLEDNPEQGIVFNVKEIDVEFNRNWNDSVSVTVNYNKDLVSLYLCNTMTETNLDYDDDSNCFKLIERNKIRGFNENFYFKMYPNIDNYILRGRIKVNTICFESEYFNKELENDLEIDLSFDPKNFELVFFEKELMLVKDGKIYHEGQEFVLKE